MWSFLLSKMASANILFGFCMMRFALLQSTCGRSSEEYKREEKIEEMRGETCLSIYLPHQNRCGL